MPVAVILSSLPAKTSMPVSYQGTVPGTSKRYVAALADVLQANRHNMDDTKTQTLSETVRNFFMLLPSFLEAGLVGIASVASVEQSAKPHLAGRRGPHRGYR